MTAGRSNLWREDPYAIVLPRLLGHAGCPHRRVGCVVPIDCPRCHSVGAVHRPANQEDEGFVVVLWRRGGEVWADGPSEDETHDPRYVCGYCGRAN